MKTKQNLSEFFRRLVLYITSDDSSVVNGTAAAFVTVLAMAQAADLLRNYLLFEEYAVAGEFLPDVVSVGLKKAAEVAHHRTGNDIFALIESVCKISARFWRLRGSYPAGHLVDLVEEMLNILRNSSLRETSYRDGIYAFFDISRNLLSGFSYAEGSVPLTIEKPEVQELGDKERIIREKLGAYPTASSIARVLKHLANEKLYPLKSFILQLENAQKALDLEMASKQLLVPDEVILSTVVSQLKSAAESAREYRSAALNCSLVSDWTYIPQNSSQVTVRLVLNNSTDKDRVGEARNVRVTPQPPVTGQPRSLATIPLILPWETGIRYDLLLNFEETVKPGRQTVNLKIVFDDFTENSREAIETIALDFKKWNSQLASDPYDPLASDEIERVTGGDPEIKRILQDELSISTHEKLPIFLQDIEKATANLSNRMQYFQLKWNLLEENKRYALIAAEQALSIRKGAHVKMSEIAQLLGDNFPDRIINWNRVIRDLVNGKWLTEENSLYRFRSSLLETWISMYVSTSLKQSHGKQL